MDLPSDYDWNPPALPEARDAPEPGRVLCFAPHPDDEVIGPGGTLCLHRDQGDPVRVVLATDGLAGDPDGRHGDGRQFGQQRRAESRAGCKVLGIDDVEFWGFPDGHVVTEVDIAAVAERAGHEVRACSPDIIYVPWHGEWHGDHRALHRGVLIGLRDCGYAGAVIGYEVWSPFPVPDLVIDVTRVSERKRDALACYTSQLGYADYGHATFGLMAYRSMIRHQAKGFAEAFRRYR